MKTLNTLFIIMLILGFNGIGNAAENEETAKSWQEQATNTRVAVMNVYVELEKMGDKNNTVATELITDAVAQLGEGDKYLKKGDDAMAAKDWEKANFGYNMAWQYYVKAATAGLNAKSILAGQ